MGGRGGKPRFRLSRDVVAEIEAMAPEFGGRDALIRQALALMHQGSLLERLEALAGRLERIADRLEGVQAAGFAPPAGVPACDAGNASRELLAAFAELDGFSRRKGGGAVGEEES